MKQYKDEADFKKDLVAHLAKTAKAVFCIETEETVKGFPDVMVISEHDTAYFYEVKQAKGVKEQYIEVQNSQILFSVTHPTLDCSVIYCSDKGIRSFPFKHLKDLPSTKVGKTKVKIYLKDIRDAIHDCIDGCIS